MHTLPDRDIFSAARQPRAYYGFHLGALRLKTTVNHQTNLPVHVPPPPHPPRMLGLIARLGAYASLSLLLLGSHHLPCSEELIWYT